MCNLLQEMLTILLETKTSEANRRDIQSYFRRLQRMKTDDNHGATRLRVGNYRVLFERKDDLKIIDIMDILPRNRAYQRR
jgi:mRNA-degrading endonuclease RelE of RelBE toxin-antitoxin system